ncbi:hypothetical protein CPC08DRAFT_761490 [Agrocybe pediades]|nr:hypothetical protein CPC08DRAFT_761490 [Agrocybe pediades]
MLHLKQQCRKSAATQSNTGETLKQATFSLLGSSLIAIPERMTTTIFVDDSDTTLQYRGTWTSQQGLVGSLSESDAAITPGYNPYYGTLHSAVVVSDDQASTPPSVEETSISYKFYGNTFTAQFAPPTKAVEISCYLNGEPQRIADTSTGAFCQSNSTDLSSGNLQELVLIAKSQNVIFDYLVFGTNIVGANAEVDLLHDENQDDGSLSFNTRVSSPGDSLDYIFNGLSMGIYALIPNTLENVTLSWSYSVDKAPSVNFTTTQSMSSLGHQLLVQTPKYSRGSHIFHLEYNGPDLSSKSTSIDVSRIIIQNRTQGVAEPEAFPVLLHGAGESTHQSDRTHNSSRSLIVGTAVGSITLLLLLITVLVLYRVRSRRRLAREEDIHPFWQGHIFQYPYIPKDRDGKSASSSVSRSEGSRASRATETGTRRNSVLYMVHQDGGEISSGSSLESGRVVVELPPTYTAIRLPVPQS